MLMSKQSWDRHVFEKLYREDADPWKFETSPYEREKYALTLECIGVGPFQTALELGCSIGVLTECLASRCHTLLAVDIAETALKRAEKRCGSCNNVSFLNAQLPQEFPVLPQGSQNLILISEMLYFLSRPDIVHLAHECLFVLQPKGRIVLVNWTGETDTPCTGDEAAELFMATCRDHGLVLCSTQRRPTYRIDCLSRECVTD